MDKKELRLHRTLTKLIDKWHQELYNEELELYEIKNKPSYNDPRGEDDIWWNFSFFSLEYIRSSDFKGEIVDYESIYNREFEIEIKCEYIKEYDEDEDKTYHYLSYRYIKNKILSLPERHIIEDGDFDYYISLLSNYDFIVNLDETKLKYQIDNF